MKQAHFLEKTSFFIFWAAFSILPFVVSRYIDAEESQSFFFVSAILLSAGIWFLAKFFEGRILFPKSGILLFGLIFAALGSFSALLSGNFEASFFGGWFETGSGIWIVSAFLCLLLSSSFFLDKKRIFLALFSFLGVFLLTGVFRAADLVLRARGGAALLPDWASGLGGSLGNFGIYAGGALLLSVFFLDSRGLRSIYRFLLWVVVATAFFFVVASGVSFLPALLSLFFLLSAGVKIFADRKKPVFPWASFSAGIFCAVFFVAGVLGWNPSAQYLGADNFEIRPSLSMTLEVYSEIPLERKIIGAGPQSFEKNWLLHKPSYVNSTPAWQNSFSEGHSYLATSLVSLGIAGFLSLLALFFFVLKGAKEASTSAGKGSGATFILWALSMYFFLSLLFYFPGPIVFACVFIFSGMFAASLATDKRIKISEISLINDPRKAFLLMIILFVLSAGALFGAYISVRTGHSAKLFEKGILAVYKSKDIKEGIRESESYFLRAIKMKKSDSYMRALANVYSLEVERIISTEEEKNDTSSVQNAFSLAEEEAKKAVAYDPENYLNHLASAKIYEMAALLKADNARSSVEESYGNAIRLSPKDPALYSSLARISAIYADIEKTRENFGKALELKGDYAPALIGMAQVEQKTGNVEKAAEYALKAFEADPRDAFILEFLSQFQKK